MAEGIKNFLEEIAQEQNYKDGHIEIRAISSEGGNYSSALFEAILTTPRKDDLKLFIKVASIGRDVRDGDKGMYDRIFATERLFYTKLAVAFDQLYNKHGVAEKHRMYIPKYYGSKSNRLEETMALESLAHHGFESFDRTKTVDWDYASRSVEELAKFHALGLAYRIEHREELNEMEKSVFSNMWTHEDMKNTFLNQAIKMGTQVIKKEYRKKVQEFLNKGNLLDGIEKLWKPSENGFLIHSDYRPSNLLHRCQVSKNFEIYLLLPPNNKYFPTFLPSLANRRDIVERRGEMWKLVMCVMNDKLEVVIVDYQTLHLGTLAADLMVFIWTSSDSQFRQQHYHQLLEHYYKELKQALQYLHYDINEVYPRSIFQQELEDTKTIGLYVGLGMMNVLTVDPEDAPKLDSFENFSIKPNERALERMNGVVEDYIRWGII